MLRSNLILAILIILVSSITLISEIPEAFSQSYSTYLTLDPLPSQVKPGDIITFKGVLGTSDDYVITDATIFIKDDVDFGADTVLGTIVTNDNGEFVATWEASKRSGGGSYDFYAVYEGSSNFARARSSTYSVYVSGSPSSYTPPSSSGSSSSSYYPTSLTLDRVPTSVYTDQTVTFTGKLTSNGSPVSKALIQILEDDPLVPDQILAQGFTDSSGRYSITWDVTGGYVETDFDVYASFSSDGTYAYARSYNQEISVLRYGGSISLDPIPSRAKLGEVVEFSGTLKLNKGSSEGAVVYIKDEDPLSADDLLATGYVDRNGRFSATWFVNYADPDDIVDIYAVFEGNDILYRQTTCDIGPTMPIGSSCSNTIPLLVYGTEPTTIPPPDDGIVGNEYMKLYYSLDFPSTPRVAIVPSPDSYSSVRSHIIPVQEGVLMWKSDLEKNYGGNWNVNFEIVEPGKLFFASKPDIIINLVTPDDEIECAQEWFGWAYIWPNPKKPIQAWVCSSNFGQKYSNNQVSATAAHEFIHAVGLGHTFNKKGDLMCSVEDGRSTCPGSFSKSQNPSSLNLAAAVKLYGNDGFKNPNNRVAYESKFYEDDSVSGTIKTPPTSPPTTVTPINTDRDNDGILDKFDSCPTIPETYNGYEDEDGCFDLIPLDMKQSDYDNDGIPDNTDQCKYQKETINNYLDSDGCPDTKKSPTDELIILIRDTDGDGIYDSKDYCTNQRETVNGYKDWDGCPDTKPFDWKKNSLDFQYRVNHKIDAIKPGVYEAERALQGVWYENPKAQAEVEDAWTDLWWAKKYLGDAEWTQKEGENFISKSRFQDAYYKYAYSWEKALSIDKYLIDITRHLDNAHKIQYGN